MKDIHVGSRWRYSGNAPGPRMGERDCIVESVFVRKDGVTCVRYVYAGSRSAQTRTVDSFLAKYRLAPEDPSR